MPWALLAVLAPRQRGRRQLRRGLRARARPAPLRGRRPAGPRGDPRPRRGIHRAPARDQRPLRRRVRGGPRPVPRLRRAPGAEAPLSRAAGDRVLQAHPARTRWRRCRRGCARRASPPSATGPSTRARRSTPSCTSSRPDEKNVGTLGFDMSADPVRRAAMERARDTGLGEGSGKVALAQALDPEPRPGFIVFVPVYAGGRVPETLEERRAALEGFVYAPFSADDLMWGIFGGETPRHIQVEIYDGGQVRRGRAHAPLGRRRPATRPGPQPPPDHPARVQLAHHVRHGGPRLDHPVPQRSAASRATRPGASCRWCSSAGSPRPGSSS